MLRVIWFLTVWWNPSSDGLDSCLVFSEGWGVGETNWLFGFCTLWFLWCFTLFTVCTFALSLSAALALKEVCVCLRAGAHTSPFRHRFCGLHYWLSMAVRPAALSNAALLFLSGLGIGIKISTVMKQVFAGHSSLLNFVIVFNSVALSPHSKNDQVRRSRGFLCGVCSWVLRFCPPPHHPQSENMPLGRSMVNGRFKIVL